MSSAKSFLSEEKLKVYEMILSSPGMTEKCKIVLQLSRQNVLLLCRLIEAWILSDKGKLEDEFLGVLPTASTTEFKLIHEEMLKKADLTEFYEKLKSI